MSAATFTFDDVGDGWRWVCERCGGYSCKLLTEQAARESSTGHTHCERPECGGAVHTDGWGNPIRCPHPPPVPDLHGWITQQIDKIESVARDATEGPWYADHPEPRHWGDDPESALIVRGKILCILDNQYNGPLNVDHIVLHDPTTVLRRCAADRKILEVHSSIGGACDGCGFDREDGYFIEQVNDCPTLLALAEGYGLTNEQRAALARPEPERPAYKPRGPMPDTSRVPPALRGPNWKSTP